MQTKRFMHSILLVAMFLSIAPFTVQAQTTPIPVDMFQLPWEQGKSWVSFDGFDNGTKRLPTSPHNYNVGGAIDFAPRANMVIGGDTSNDWVVAVAAGRVIEISFCHLKLDHGNGWISEYWHLDNIQVALGQNVSRNQRLAIIHNNATQQVCAGNENPGPHLHFVLRPKMKDFVLSGWVINYNVLLNKTSFTKNGQTVNRLEPILNIPNLQIVSRGGLSCDTNYTGSVDPYRYERWNVTLTQQTDLTVNLSTTSAGLVPVIVLLNSGGVEITRASGVLNTTQPAGNYFIQIQADAGTGFYNLITTCVGGSIGTTTPTANLTQTTATPTVNLTQTTATPTIDLTQFPATATPTPTVNLTQTTATFTPTVNLTQTTATSVSVTPTVDLTQFPITPTVDLTQTTATFTSTPNLTLTPGFTTPTTDLTQFPATATPTVNLTQTTATFTPTIDLTQFPATTTPTVNLTQTTATFTPTIDLTQFPATATPTPFATNTNTPISASPTVDLTQFPATATPTLVVVSPTVDLTQFPATSTPTLVGVSPTVDLTQFPATATPTFVATNTITPTSTIVVTPTNTSVPTPTGPFVLTSVTQNDLLISTSTIVTVSLFNVPLTGYSSAEITCTYNPAIISANNIGVGSLFGADPASAIFGPQNGSFIVAIAGSNGNKATADGVAFTFDITGLSVGQSSVECTARVSSGSGTLENISFIPDSVTVLAELPSATPTLTPTATPIPFATVNGQVLAGKPVTVQLFDVGSNLIASVNADVNGNFNFTAPAGNYTIIASAPGYLDAQGAITLVGGATKTMQTVTLPAGDIDGNGVIDQFDALTIGMNYNLSTPTVADLNNDGVINVLDAELLADNYRLSGAVVWQ